jgi:hypothetical protein
LAKGSMRVRVPLGAYDISILLFLWIYNVNSSHRHGMEGD